MPKVKSRNLKKQRKSLPKVIENKPKVSVILTSYNHAAYVATAIQSVLNQTFTDFELLIFDDGSTDNSQEIIRSFDDPRIKTFLYEENRGARIAAIEPYMASKGKYIAVNHSDDVWREDKLQKQVEFLDAHEDYAACFTWANFIDENGNIQNLDEGDSYKNLFEQPNRSRAEWLNYFFHKSNCLCHPSLMMRREAYTKYHIWDNVQGLWQLQDYAQWIKLCFYSNFYIINENLVQFRLRRKKQENISAFTFATTVRSKTELFLLMQTFMDNFKNDEFFLEVFPETKKYLIDGKFNRQFAFAKLCLEKNDEAINFVGLEILKKLISDDDTAAQIKRLYNYDEKAFFLDAGNYDIFNLAQKLSMLKGQLFYDTGAGFNTDEFIEKNIFVDSKGAFYAKFVFDSDKPIKNLRFDPGENFISLFIKSININGVEQKDFSAPFAKYDGKFYNFLTSDPQIIFPTNNLTGTIILEILAEFDRNYSLKLNNYFEESDKQISELNSALLNLNSRANDLERSNTELSAANLELQAQNQNLQTHNHNLQTHNQNLQTHNQNLQTQNKNLQTQNKQFRARNKNLQVQNQNLQAQNQNLQAHSQNLQAQLDAANAHINNVTAENQQLHAILNEVFDSNSWKMTEPLRKLGRLLRSSNKDKALSVARLFYKAMPLGEETKTKLKDNFYKKFSPILKNTNHYKFWLESQTVNEIHAPQQIIDPANIQNKFFAMLEEQPGKIAIHAHIFYMDLAEEIANYFSNMPYKFDALISIIDPKEEKKIKSIFGKIENVENLIVRVVPNRGRDVAPFVCGFGDIILNYDFIAHIHSKKSLYTGSEQQKWRHYLFDAILGSSERIKKIFYMFNQNKNVGLIYPKPAENVPYAAFTWLSNRQIGNYLLNKIGVLPSKTDYFDFPAGTMFWARTKGLRKFFNSLSIEDFPEEQGQNDGTLAHAFERAVTLTVNSEGMDFYEFDPELEIYTVNTGNKNMWQYYGRSDIELQWVLDHGKIISFDLFDTLFMRRLAVPYLVNELIKLKVEDLLGKKFDFTQFRLDAEDVARKNSNSDVTLDDIYKSFSDLTGLDEKTCKKIREIEVATEVEMVLPREEMLSWFNRIIQHGRKIWIISDMYLQTPDIERLLQKCDISGYEKLLISCETGMRKDTAEIWNHLVDKGFAKGKLVHLGDNEMSDVQLPSDRIIFAYHVMSAINLFSQTHFGRIFLNALDRKMPLYTGMLFGTILAEKFHNPFQLRNLGDGGGKLTIRNFRDLGYWLYGTPILTFMLWLIKKSAQDDIQQIFFLSRDGYFLQPLYSFVTKLLGVEELPNSYFYASRRSVTVASIHEISQTHNLLKLRFEGTVRKFFEVRFGMEVDDDTEIFLPSEEDGEYVKKVIEENSEEILSIAADERKNYEVYIKSLGEQFDKIGVVDMGYSGTIQFYLQKILQKNLTGYYLATSATNLFGPTAAERLRGCFTENDDYGKTKSAVYKYQLLFEAILTAPDPQLQYFDSDGDPIFGNPEPAQFQIENIREIHEGIKDFCRDVLTHFGKYILRTEIDFNFVDAWVRAFVQDENIIAPEIRKIFAFDDQYCNTFTGNALDLYLGGGA